MTCPMRFDRDREVQVPFEKPHIFETIAEPHELKNYVDDAIYLTGGQFAILCQFAHPGLAEGSYKHSNFAYRILNRLQTTARFLNAAVYGTQQEKEAIFSVIHSAHSDVKGETYYADDPELHKWTAATLFVSLVVVHEAFFGKLSREKQEALYKESAVYGTSLRMPPEMWPATLDAFWEYWHHMIATLEVTDWARNLAGDLLHPKKLPLWLKPQAPVARLLTIHWMPERLQREYGLTVTPLNKAMYHFVVGYTALVYPHLPKSLKQLPSKMYMKDMKKAVKRIEETGTWYKAAQA
ncbi:hypothetical protein PFICI_13598 [Pestalotiopsis fici W106-1]|uniref:ER-bound oxygenase mpaB/mpaB'/Rubber oxygenase catalytic domain-containing protein n=1 Tax=Pestalotiopsis fici (strain W106-1 / CGMCC3.15140) TaxID=1229662 RepID=W3WMV8_PESFW|nr:uncharacterized protein PFICI_13598 [Pestalotiopsis fici W106-1]ETS75114.1 hypothetical protein PFICI_13598 [Pestalotiopsis fici W106-1]